MKNTLCIMFDIALIAIGLILIPIGFLKWSEMGYLIEAWSDRGLFEGRSSFFIMTIGIASLLYGVFDLWVFRLSVLKKR